MMTQSRGIQADRSRRSREPGSGNEHSGSGLALSHEWTESKSRHRERSKKLRGKRELNCREQRSKLTCRAKATSS